MSGLRFIGVGISFGAYAAIGFVEQSARVERIEDMLSETVKGQQATLAALDGLQARQQSMSATLSNLQSLAMESLGVSSAPARPGTSSAPPRPRACGANCRR